jgi:hypothetical protein
MANLRCRQQIAIGVLCTLFAGATSATADGTAGAARPPVDIAPALAINLLRHTATVEFGTFMSRLPLAARRKLAGAYVAFDDSATDISSMIGCDDDGDYVVVVTDALLGLAVFIAKAEAADEMFGTHKVDDYATFLAEAPRGRQVRGLRHDSGSDGARSKPEAAAWSTPEETPRKGVRPLPPPPGFFDASEASSPIRLQLEAARYREIVGAVVAHELAHFLLGYLECPNPTDTHEPGDDQWTGEERERSLDWALERYTPERVLLADRDATIRLLDGGLTELGGLAWLRTIERVEQATKESEPRKQTCPTPTYLQLHHDSKARIDVVRAVAAEWRESRAAPLPGVDHAATSGLDHARLQVSTMRRREATKRALIPIP